jgi:general secretion pathway protein C
LSVDVYLKRYFTPILLGLVALSAFLQARGVGQLLSAAMVSERPMSFPPLGTRMRDAVRISSAQAIRDKNPFDSVTGPLHPEAVEAVKGPIEVSDPLAVSVCPGVTVHILTETNDPLWSFAAVSTTGEQHPKLRRVGDAVGDKKVAYIGFNPRTATPTVWFEGDTLCQVSLFGAQPVAAPAGEAPAAPAPEEKGAAHAVDPDIASKIRKISETEFEIDRSGVDKILENQGELMKSARIVPEQKDGKVVGIRLFGIRPETLLGHMGFQNGDRLEQMNGFDMGSPEKALEA